MTAAYPLTWPETMPRYSKHGREKGSFRTTLNAAINNVLTSLKNFGRDSGKAAQNIVISSNVTLGVTRPADPGVAVWFLWDGMQVCIPVDRYASVEANLQAIHHVLEARRTEMRHGTLALVRATFQGFVALPSPTGKRGWRDVLGFAGAPTPTTAAVESRYRELAKDRHPDHPRGSHEAMAELNAAKTEALKELGS